MIGSVPRRAAIAGVVVVLLCAVIAWVVAHRHQPPPPSKDHVVSQQGGSVAGDVIPVSVVPVQYGAIAQTLTLTGTIQSPNTANVSAMVPGQVQGVYATAGQTVQAGQLLAQVNAAQASAQVAQAEQQLLAAQSAYEKAVAGRDLTRRQAEGDVRQAEIGLREALAGQAKANAGAGAPAIEQARANARQAHAAAREAANALRRTRYLYDHGVVPLSTLEDVQTKAQQAEDGAIAADAGVQAATQGATSADRELAATRVAQAREGLREARQAVDSRLAVADADVAAARTQVTAAGEQVRVAKLQEAGTRIVSPIAGVVSSVRIHAGEEAAPGMPLFVVTSLGDVYFDTVVSETEKLQLTPGQQARITLQALPGLTLNGFVREVVPVQNPGATGFEARISLTRPPGVVIPPGAYATAKVQTGYAAHTLVIPSRAVLNDASGAHYVYVVRRNSASPTGQMADEQPIVTGLTTTNEVQALNGLNERDRVITAGAELLVGKKQAPVMVESEGSSVTTPSTDAAASVAGGGGG